MPDFLLDALAARPEALAVAEHEATCTYRELVAHYQQWREKLAPSGIGHGDVVSLEGDYGIEAIAVLLAAALHRCIVVPLSSAAVDQHPSLRALARVQHRIIVTTAGSRIQHDQGDGQHRLYDSIRADGSAGLVLFSSGSTGQSKAVVHDMSRLLDKFRSPRPAFRTLVFLQFDHIGGINTIFHTLTNGGAIVIPRDRSPRAVCEAISRQRAELLPTSPTFLNLLLLSGEHEQHDLSSLRLVTYGTEPMPQSTLERAVRALPQVEFRQTYGLSELGILRTKSRDPKSLWLRVGGNGYETRIKDGRLWIRAESAMIGYLNAPDPFDADGFFDTGDQVDVDGEWLRIRGRNSEIINVGGNKVYPAEVESVLQELDNVAAASVHAERNPITGQIVAVNIRLRVYEAPLVFKTRMRSHCQGRLPSFAVPAKVRFSDEPLHTNRFKRVR